jgi:hypothetical protein
MALKTKRKPYVRSTLDLLLSLAMVAFPLTIASTGQNSAPASNAPEANSPSAMPAGPAQRWENPPDDITRREIAEMDSFLDNHPEIAEQLRKDPSLVDNRQWVANHPALQEYLQTHPQVADAFRAHPNMFMHDENRYDQRADRRDAADMARFMDSHPEIAQQLRRDPSLIDNQQWVANHPALQEYLRDHPQIADEFRADPSAFIRDETRDDINRRDVADMAQFLDKHPEIAEQLRNRPWLADDRTWVDQHPALREYLQDHTQIADAFRSDPSLLMKDVERYDNETGNHQQASNFNGNEHFRGELTSFGQFLGSHSTLATELSNDPSLASNKEYLANHPELDEYLKVHPEVSEQLAQNPQAVMGSSAVQESGGLTTKPAAAPKPKSGPNQ